MTEAQRLVFDHTAITALFQSHRRAYAYYRRAEENHLQLVLPAAAVAEANRTLQATWNEWEAVLYPTTVTVAPLDEHAALEVGLLGELATGHTIYEARTIHGLIITGDPDPYQHTGQPLRVL